MDVVGLLLKSAVAPGAVALLLAAVSRGRLAGVGVAGGLLTTYLLLLGWQGFPPVDATHWAPWVALAGGVLGLWPADRAPAARLAAVVVALLGSAWLLVAPLAAHAFSAGETALALAATALTGLAAERATVAAEPQAGRAGLLALALVFAGMAGALGLSGTLFGAQLAGAVAAGLGALFLLALTPFGRVPLPALGPAVGIAYGLLVATGGLYAELPPLAWAVLAVAPLAVLLARSLGARARRPLVGLAVAGAVALVPVGAAGAIAQLASASDGDAASATPSAPGPDGAPAGDEAADDDYGYE
ncbi:MAG: hypothetical protein H6745_19190 [Deltaproteobacteria bacterium]|nr:hypothetical protein [Deltaproteobacteria bacterium]